MNMYLLAQEVATDLPAWQELLFSESGLGIAVVVVGLIWGLIKRKAGLDEGKKSKITEAFETAVKETYDEFVKVKKSSAKDGKLSVEDVAHARQMAIAKAKDIGKEKGVDILKEVGKSYIPVLLEKVIAKAKKGE